MHKEHGLFPQYSVANSPKEEKAYCAEMSVSSRSSAVALPSSTLSSLACQSSLQRACR